MARRSIISGNNGGSEIHKKSTAKIQKEKSYLIQNDIKFEQGNVSDYIY